MVDRAGLVIGVSVGVALGFLTAVLVFFSIRCYKKRAHLRRCANEHSLTTLPICTNGLGTSTGFSASLTNSIAIQGSENLRTNSHRSWWNHQNKDRFVSASGIPKHSYKDIQKATQNFTTVLGEGSFGPVYKAMIATGEVVAVKALASNSKQGEKEFQTEVLLLERLHHRNLVNLLGYCVDKGQRMLIYEFMSNGSLENMLYGDDRILSWGERLQIALDISHGIEYLHEGAAPPVIHRDLKSANILLDNSMRAKVADFGLSKEENFDGRILALKLITVIHPHQNLMDYINLAAMSSDGVDVIVDKKLGGEFNVREVRELASIAYKCLGKSQRQRPSIAKVSHAILKIKQRRLAKEDTMSFAGNDLS